MKPGLVFLSMILFVSNAFAADLSSTRENLELTVYNQDFALVKENRFVELQKGINAVRLRDVAAQIDPTSVRVQSLDDPEGLTVLEQNYVFDLVNYGKLLEKYVGKEIEFQEVVDTKTGEIRVKKAKLLSTGYFVQANPYGSRGYQYQSYGQPVYEMEGKIYSSIPGNIVFPASGEELVLTPALDWQLKSSRDGQQKIEMAYITDGIKWNADYILVLDSKDTHVDMNGWVTLDNRSGVSYPEAKLKLMAGEVRVLSAYGADGRMAAKAQDYVADLSGSAQFREAGFFEYHLYTLQRPTTIQNNEIKQVEFTRAANVPVNKLYVYEGFQGDYGYEASYIYPDFGKEGLKKVNVWVEFKNSKENHLGIPLPKGRARFYKQDDDNGQEFIGEDNLDHTPKDELVRFYIGNAFDLVGERKQLDYKVMQPEHLTEETFEITLRNHKEEDVTILVKERLYRGKQWEIVTASQDFQKKDVQLMETQVSVPKNGEKKVTYTVRYHW